MNGYLTTKTNEEIMHKGRLGFIKIKAHKPEQEKAMHKREKEHEDNPPKYNFGE